MFGFEYAVLIKHIEDLKKHTLPHFPPGGSSLVRGWSVLPLGLTAVTNNKEPSFTLEVYRQYIHYEEFEV